MGHGEGRDLVFLWFATFPFAQMDSTGKPTSSTNPLVDAHLVDALVLLVPALACAGTTWGLGRMWARIPFVGHHRWAP